MTPSDLICVDQSMPRWYGVGGDWMDMGLSHYVARDLKPESGCEIQDAACGRSGIMLRLEIVTATDQTREKDFEDEMPHGAAVVRRLVDSWISTKRIVRADSYLASVLGKVVKGEEVQVVKILSLFIFWGSRAAISSLFPIVTGSD